MTTNTKQQNKNTPHIRFPEFTGNWEKGALGQFSKIKMGQSPDSKFYNSNGEGEFLIQGNADINERVSSPRNWTTQITKECDIGDILMTVRAPVGYVAISKHKAVIGRGVCSMENLNTSDMNFLFQYLLNYENKWNKYSQGSTFTAVNSNDIKNLKVVFPTFPEQQKIASFLTAVDEWIENLRDQKKNLELYKKGMMQKIFSQQIRFKDENGNDYPEWEEKRLESVFDISAGNSKSEYINNEGEKIIVDMGGVSQHGGLIASKRTKYAKDFLTVNDLVMPKDDIGGGFIIGKVARIPNNNKYICGDHIYKMSKLFGDIGYLYYAINSFAISKSLRRKANGTAQLGLSNSSVKNQIIPFPSLLEQQKIANFLTSIDNLIELKQQQIAFAEKWKKGLMQGLFV